MSYLDVLAQQGAIDPYAIDDIMDRASSSDADVDTILEDMQVPQEAIRRSKAQFFNLPERQVDARSITYDLLKFIPEESARHYRFVPIGMTDGILEIGMIDPADLEAKNALQFISSKINMPYRVFVITPNDLNGVLENYLGLSDTVQTNDSVRQLEDDDMPRNLDEDLDGEELVKSASLQNQNLSAADRIVEDAPITKTVAVILRNAIEGGASDIHIEHIGEKVKVRFRVDGTLYTSLLLPKSSHSAVVARIKILAKLKLDEKRKPQDGRFPAKIDGRKIDFRVSTLPTFYGEKVVIRILDPERGVKRLEDTGMTPAHIAMVREAINRPYGIILITGPTGAGKTTTLYAMVKEIDREKHNVISLEDPVEYQMEGMNQSQVRPEIGYTFANGLRSILRQDPDIIMVGEIRDKETAELAIQAALTGHLVLATLHTNNSIGVIPRLVDMGVDPYLIAPTLELAIAQRMVKRLCPNTGTPVHVQGALKALIDRQFATLPEQVRAQYDFTNTQVYDPVPSADCPSGTHGRLGVFEMYRKDRELEKIILDDANEAKIYDYLRSQGMLTMKEDAILKAVQGQIPFSEVNTL